MYPSSAIFASDPLVPLHAVRSSEIPIFCIPGAGASVTAFNEFFDALGARWPVYGLQPRGIDGAEQPHQSVEAAALYNLGALAQLNFNGPIHLLGHSYGGLVAFDMALRLQKQKRSVASLTLIDTEPPETPHEAGTSHIFNQFVGVFESIFDRTLYVNETIIASCEIELFISNLHAALVKARCLPARSTPDVLRGSLATFAAACRTTYVPHGLYTGKLHLVLVSAACRNKSFNDDVTRQRAAYAVQWRRWAAELDVWYGPGHHFSILQVPHVRSLATWWRQARDLESAPGT